MSKWEKLIRDQGLSASVIQDCFHFIFVDAATKNRIWCCCTGGVSKPIRAQHQLPSPIRTIYILLGSYFKWGFSLKVLNPNPNPRIIVDDIETIAKLCMCCSTGSWGTALPWQPWCWHQIVSVVPMSLRVQLLVCLFQMRGAGMGPMGRRRIYHWIFQLLQWFWSEKWCNNND